MEADLRTVSCMCWVVTISPVGCGEDRIYWMSCGVLSGDAAHPDSQGYLGCSSSQRKQLRVRLPLRIRILDIRHIPRVHVVWERYDDGKDEVEWFLWHEAVCLELAGRSTAEMNLEGLPADHRGWRPSIVDIRVLATSTTGDMNGS